VLPKLTDLKPGVLQVGASKEDSPALSIYKVRRIDGGLVTDGPPQFGTIEWSGYISPAIDPNTQKVDPDKLRIELRGAVSSPVGNSGNSVGTITLTERMERDLNTAAMKVATPLTGYVTTGLYQALSEDQRTVDYWQSIPSCDLITSSQKQDLTSRATQVNEIFKLTNAQRLRLQQ
jgi:hypothetical protein